MREVTIHSIGVSLENYQRVVILKEKAGERYLPIWIGPGEANAIATKVQQVAVPRPLTHDLIHSVISNLGVSLDSAHISDIREDTLYGKIILNLTEGQKEVDSRPSDALALAVTAGAPIFVEETVLDKAGIFLDKETGKPIDRQAAKGGSVSQDELRRMSAFTDFINTLDLGDFGEGRQENE